MRKYLLPLAVLVALLLVMAPISDAQITTQVVTETGTQTLTNKTIPASNTVTINWADITDVSVLLTELAELEAIGAVTISANQWAVLGGIAETLTAAELDLLDGITVLSGSNTGDVAETNNLETSDPPNVADTEIYIGTGAGAGAWAVLSGDATMANTGAVTVVDDLHAHTATSISGLGTADISGLDVSDDLNLAAGAGLTLTGDSVALDAENIKHSLCMYVETPVTDEEFFTVWRAPVAVTVTEIYCEVESATSVILDFEVDDGSPTGINGSDITCTTSGVTDSSFAGDTTLADGDRLDLDLGTVTGTVHALSVCLEYTVDDV